MSKVTFKGSPATLSGAGVNVGEKAPVVEVVAQDLGVFTVGGASDKIQIIAAMPSLDTGVCAAEARKFNEKVAGKSGVQLSVITMDLPFAMGRFCTTEGIENIRVGSDFRGAKFGEAYGIKLADTPLQGLLARSIFVVAKDGTLIYKEIVSEITEEPNYDAVFAAISASGGCGCGCGAH